MRKFLHSALPLLLAGAFLTLLVPLSGRADLPVIQHDLQATIDPDAGRLTVIDRLTLPPGQDTIDFILHAGMAPRVRPGEGTLEVLGRDGDLETLRLRLSPGATSAAIAYEGTIRHPLAVVSEGMGRERQVTAGTIGPDGVFLDGNSGWYPRVPGTLQRFSLTVSLPADWQAVSQGAGPDGDPPLKGVVGSTWIESQPQDDIYLIAAPFTLYRDHAAGVEAQVWLRTADAPLAARYLAATRDYLDLYGRLIGPYPYAKFALVENFWETGYGMPSFTLLGPQVIRLPFIITSSYPHEVLHNWWGNGVYIDYQGGNWSEGLTAYLADHLLKEREGQGAAYRRDSLSAYADYVRTGSDFPLTEFRARHGAASQAIGYGKAAMLFHMLRIQLGDAAFRQGLRGFYADNRFRIAGYPDLRRAFESASSQDLGAFFDAWTRRGGASRLALTNVMSEPVGTGYRVTGEIAQTQGAAPFPLRVPVVVHQAQGAPIETLVRVDERSARFAIDLPSAPVRLAVDPAFDTFRLLEPGESPVALSGLFGAGQGLILLPGDAQPALLAAYRALATDWQRGHAGWRIALDSDQPALPTDQAIWLLGWENHHLSAFADGGQGFSLDPTPRSLSITGNAVDTTGASLVLTRQRGAQPLGWVAAASPAALPGLTRKLPHYGKYGYLVFAGDAPDNRLKGQWPPGDSPLVHWFSEARPTLAPVPRPSLVEAR
ncbi:MAG TPA: M1 family aminopeptidase [Lamprocystis sp. (in: g-proteobacteria)]|nr:M1 family aminopeptidase [Lamprocystis sp. (in: g-proteobacteria)]